MVGGNVHVSRPHITFDLLRHAQEMKGERGDRRWWGVSGGLVRVK